MREPPHTKLRSRPPARVALNRAGPKIKLVFRSALRSRLSRAGPRKRRPSRQKPPQGDAEIHRCAPRSGAESLHKNRDGNPPCQVAPRRASQRPRWPQPPRHPECPRPSPAPTNQHSAPNRTNSTHPLPGNAPRVTTTRRHTSARSTSGAHAPPRHPPASQCPQPALTRPTLT